jgi:ribosomal protein S30
MGFDPRTVQTVSGPGRSRIHRKVEVQREEIKANLRKTTIVRNYTHKEYQRRINAASGLKGRGRS